VNSFTHAANSSGYKPTTIQQFLNDHPVPADAIVRVEDGAWVNAESDWGHPQFINWLWPLYSKTNYRFDPNGWTEDARNWAVITATENYVTIAEDLEGGNLRIDKIADGGAAATNAEKAWHFYFGGLNSGFMYYGKAEDMEVKPSMTGNIAIEYAQKVINANSGVDNTAPSVFIPQRFPYNPGSVGFGPHTGYKKVDYASDFHVWTYAYDVSGLNSVTLKYRIDNDGWNPVESVHNEIYTGGSEVGDWLSISMNRQPMAADPVNDGELNFFILPQAKADLCYAEIKDYKEVLIDYYVEAVDAKGNTFKTPIQHVYVGKGVEDTGGGTGDITVSFKRPDDWGTAGVNLWAWNASGNIFSSWPGELMKDMGNGWFSYDFAESITSVNVIFSKSGNPQSVDITGVIQTTCYEYDVPSGTKFTVKTATCPTSSVNNPVEMKALVYPQPATDKFIVDLPNLDMSETYVMSIIDINGKIVRKEVITETITVFERGSLQSGVYFVRVQSPDVNKAFSSKLLLK
jgi:hypothetical protein